MILVATGAAVAVGAPSLLHPKTGEGLSRILVLLLFAYIAQSAFRALGVFGRHPLSGPGKALLATSILVLVAAVGPRLSSDVWTRSRRAIAVFAIVYCTSPWALVALGDKHRDVSLAGVGGSGVDRSGGPTVVLLLDEFSGAETQRLAEALRDAGAPAVVAEIPAAGDNTIDVVPQMFGSMRLTGIRQCTTTALCGNEGVFDFAGVHFKPEEQVHIVGMFHPYCATRGWKSCYQDDRTGQSALNSLLCTYLRLAPWLSIECEPLPIEVWAQFRKHMLDRVRESEFWNSGGHLFAHLPLPHPPGTGPATSLGAEYLEGIERATELAVDVWKRGEHQWPGRFRLVVVSDHPLRTTLWCKFARYAAFDCSVRNEWTRATVPFAAAGWGVSAANLPTSNSGLFVPVTTRRQD